MLAIHVPTWRRRVAAPMSWAVAMTSLLTSAAKIASKPASSASRATAWISLARQPVPGMTASPSRSAMGASFHQRPAGHLRGIIPRCDRQHAGTIVGRLSRDDDGNPRPPDGDRGGEPSSAGSAGESRGVPPTSALHEEDERGEGQEREDHAAEAYRVELAEEGDPRRHAGEGGHGENGGRLPDVARQQAGPPVADEDDRLVHHEEAGDVR